MNTNDLMKLNDNFVVHASAFSTEALTLALGHAQHAYDNNGNCAPMTDLFDKLQRANKGKLAASFRSFWMEFFPVVRGPSKKDKKVLVFKLRDKASDEDWKFDEAKQAEFFAAKPRQKVEPGSKGIEDFAKVLKRVWKSDEYDAATRALARKHWEALPCNNEQRIKELEAKLAEFQNRDAA